MAVTGVTRCRVVKECLADNVSVLTMIDSVVAASRERGYIALPADQYLDKCDCFCLGPQCSKDEIICY